jgi:hypothetical protein
VRLLLQLLKRGPDYTPPHIVLKSELRIRTSSQHLLPAESVLKQQHSQAREF